jgi:hypothetical protein
MLALAFYSRGAARRSVSRDDPAIAQNVGEPILRVDVVELGRLDQQSV